MSNFEISFKFSHNSYSEYIDLYRPVKFFRGLKLDYWIFSEDNEFVLKIIISRIFDNIPIKFAIVSNFLKILILYVYFLVSINFLNSLRLVSGQIEETNSGCEHINIAKFRNFEQMLHFSFFMRELVGVF